MLDKILYICVLSILTFSYERSFLLRNEFNGTLNVKVRNVKVAVVSIDKVFHFF